MIEKFVNWYLGKENLVTMPKDWVTDVQNDMEQLKEDRNSYRNATKQISKAYNELLMDYAKCAPVKALKEDLTEAGVECHKTKEELTETYYETFKVSYEINKKDKKGKKED